jgi:APA family basic amino acid/polyamine antiporter
VHKVHGEWQTRLGLLPPDGYQADPVLGLVDNLGLHGSALHGLRIYVGVLAGTILIIAANAGVIGSSRITYAMASYRQLPEIFRRLHPRFKTPVLSLLCFSGLLSIATLLPGKIDFLGTMYSFGAMLSFAVANASLIALRVRFPDTELAVKGRPNLRFRGIDWPLFAIFGFLGTSAAWVVVVVQRPLTRWVGFGWLAAGFATFVVYRVFVLRTPLTTTLRAPVAVEPSSLEYHSILVPVFDGRASDEAMDVAARLAADRRATIVVAAAVQLPLDLPLDAELPEQHAAANERLDRARAIGESYGLRVVTRLLRGRSAGRMFVDETLRHHAELVVMGAPRRLRGGRSLFEDAAHFVLKHAPCRVMVVAPRDERLERFLRSKHAISSSR